MPADQVVDFATLYGQNCAGCHGADGKLGPAPPLNDPLFLAIVPDAVLLQHDRRGPAGDADAGLRPEARGAAHRRPGESARRRDQAALEARSVRRTRPPAYLVATATGAGGDAGRGRSVFDRACASCHGAERARAARTRSAPIHDPAFLALISDQACADTSITGRPRPGDARLRRRRTAAPTDFQPLTPDRDRRPGRAAASDWRQASARRDHDHDLEDAIRWSTSDWTRPARRRREPLPSRRHVFFRWADLRPGRRWRRRVVGLPLVGYLLGPKRRPIDWVGLGRVAGLRRRTRPGW